MAGSVEEQKKLKLYSYFWSSCSYRVRIGLKLKGLEYEYKAVNLLKGEHFSPEFTKLNPIGYVPVLVDEDIVVSDSFAILLYLEEKYPPHPLLPCDLQRRAINYQAANIVSSSIQPFQNTSVLKSIAEKFNPDEQYVWARNHIGKGLEALEKLLHDYAGKYATGDEVYLDPDCVSVQRLWKWMDSLNQPKPFLVAYWISKYELRMLFEPQSKHNYELDAWADCFIAPQLYAAIKWFSLDMTPYPLLSRLNEAYNQLPTFVDSAPENQPDTPV